MKKKEILKRLKGIGERSNSLWHNMSDEMGESFDVEYQAGIAFNISMDIKELIAEIEVHGKGTGKEGHDE